MKTEKFRAFLLEKGYESTKITEAVTTVQEMSLYFNSKRPSQKLTDVTEQMLQEYMDVLIEKGKNDYSKISSIARYFYCMNNHDRYIQMTKYLGGHGVFESICERFSELKGMNAASLLFADLVQIPLGTSPKKIPEYTIKLMQRLEEQLTHDDMVSVLAGNNHRIPREAMLKEKAFYDQAPSLDEYLKERNQRMIAELQRYCNERKIWFEQVITQEVVDFVGSNQEILSAVRQGDKLYVTKIPYDTSAYLKADEPTSKAYYACHCPFARESLSNDAQTISANWCYCSGGFAKFPFEVVLEQNLTVKLLSSVLQGDPECRFEISLAGVEYKA